MWPSRQPMIVRSGSFAPLGFKGWFGFAAEFEKSDVAIPGEANSLAARFIVAGAIVLFTGLGVLGSWVSQRIEQGVLQVAAQSKVIAMESVLEPLVQELATAPRLSDQSLSKIDSLLRYDGVATCCSSMVLWRPDGTIVYAADRSSIGQTERGSAGMQLAAQGDVHVELADHTGDWGMLSAAGPNPLRIYAPVHKIGTGQIIAIAGFLEPAKYFEQELQQARRETWLVVGALTLMIFILLYFLACRAAQVMTHQHRSLVDLYGEQVRLNMQNVELREDLQRARRDGIEINENLLRRIGSDLHDGPAQLLALAMLKLPEVIPQGCLDEAVATPRDVRAAEAVATVQIATAKALKEIRDISAGLALPELQRRSPSEAIRLAVSAHEQATGTRVDCSIGCLPAHIPMDWTVCLYRFVQEGLNNAFRHAGGSGQRLIASCSGSHFIVAISDSGPGFDVEQALKSTERLGLAGLRNRVGSIGGVLEIVSEVGEGTRICVTLPNCWESKCHG
jgi:signal transduction histidine kinase